LAIYIYIRCRPTTQGSAHTKVALEIQQEALASTIYANAGYSPCDVAKTGCLRGNTVQK
jgi:hypothetical protein